MSLRTEIPLQKRKVYKKGLAQSLGLLVFALFATGVLSVILTTAVDDLSQAAERIIVIALIGVPVLFILLVVGNFLYEYHYWKQYFYDANEHNINIRKGVVAQKEITLPFNRITDVYVDQDILDVLFGLYDLHISTPTAESVQFAHIDGVSKEGSERLKKMILKRINNDT